MANRLLSIGVTRHTCRHLGTKCSRLAHLLYATAKIGAVAVTINTSYKSELAVLKNADMHTLC